jgi:hypothetical protein
MKRSGGPDLHDRPAPKAKKDSDKKAKKASDKKKEVVEVVRKSDSTDATHTLRLSHMLWTVIVPNVGDALDMRDRCLLGAALFPLRALAARALVADAKRLGDPVLVHVCRHATLPVAEWVFDHHRFTKSGRDRSLMATKMQAALLCCTTNPNGRAIARLVDERIGWTLRCIVHQTHLCFYNVCASGDLRFARWLLRYSLS